MGVTAAMAEAVRGRCGCGSDTAACAWNREVPVHGPVRVRVRVRLRRDWRWPAPPSVPPTGAAGGSAGFDPRVDGRAPLTGAAGVNNVSASFDWPLTNLDLVIVKSRRRPRQALMMPARARRPTARPAATHARAAAAAAAGAATCARAGALCGGGGGILKLPTSGELFRR